MTDLEYHFTEQVTKRGISINYNGKDCFVFDLMYYDSVYSFSFKTKFQSQSLIEILYNSNIIKHKRLSFYKEDNTIKKGIFYIDEIPFINQFNFQAIIPIYTDSIYWRANLSNIIINDVMYQNDFPIRFSTGNRELSIPKDFDIGLFIKEEMNCKMEFGTYYRCDSDKINQFPNITFVFNHIKYYFNYKDFSEESVNHEGTSYIYIRKNRENKNERIIGNSFILKYVSTFDYDKNRIILYSHNKFEIMTESKNKVNYINVVTIILSIIGIILNCSFIIY